MSFPVVAPARSRYRDRQGGLAMRLRKVAWVVVLMLPVLAVSRLVHAGGNCAGTSTGRIPLVDLPPGLYQGFEGGLYPQGANQRPGGHEQAADRLARPRLLDAAGLPDALNGRIVL